jgi:hypothetical protein
MKQEYLITVRSKGIKQIEKDFLKAGASADNLLARAGGLNNGFKKSSRELRNLVSQTERWGRAMAAVKAPPIAGFRLISSELSLIIQKMTIIRTMAGQRLLPAGQGFQTQGAAYSKGFTNRDPYKQIELEKDFRPQKMLPPGQGFIHRTPEFPTGRKQIELDKTFRQPLMLPPGQGFDLKKGGIQSSNAKTLTTEYEKQNAALLKNSNAHAAINQAANESFLTQKKASTVSIKQDSEELAAMRKIEAANDAINKSQAAHSRVVQSQNKHEEKLRLLKKDSAKMDYNEYQKEKTRLKDRIHNHQQAREMLTRRNDAAKKAAQELRGPGGVHPIDQGIKNLNKQRKATGDLDKTQKVFNKTQKNTGKNQSFINSGFAKFSIIMSGIAATLFVWQTISRIIANVVRIGTDMEKSWANVADKLDLSANAMARLGDEAHKAQVAGTATAPEYTDLIAGMVEYGATAEGAMAAVNAALEKQANLMQGTVSGELDEFVGLWRELAHQSFDAIAGTDTLDNINKHLKDIVDAEGTWDILITGAEKYLRVMTTMNPALRAAKAWLTWLYGNVGDVFSAIASGAETALVALKKFFEFKPDKESVYDPKIYEGRMASYAGVYTAPGGVPTPAEVAENSIERGGYADNDAAEDFSEVYAWAEKLDKTVYHTFTGIEGANELLKLMPKGLKEAHGIMGMFLGDMKALKMLEIDKMMEAIKVAAPTLAQSDLDDIQKIFVERVRREGMDPLMKMWENYYTKVGRMDQDHYDERLRRIDEDYKVNLKKFGGENNKDAVMKAEQIRSEETFKLDEDKFREAEKIYKEYFSLIGAMTKEDLNHRFMLIGRQYEKDLDLLGDTRAKMLKEEREYLLSVQTMAKPVAFYKRVYDELGEMSEVYYNSEQARIDNDFKHNKLIDEKYAKTLKAREEFSLTQKFIFADALEMSKDEIKALEEIFQKTGVASEALINYWNLFNKFQVSRLKSMSGDEGAAQSLQIELDYKVFQDSNKKFVQQAEKTYAVTKVMDQEYIDYRISNIRMMTIAYLDSLEKQGIARDEALNKAEAYENSLLKGFEFEQDKPKMDLLKQGMADTKMMTEELYDFMAAKAAWERDEFIRITGRCQRRN